jgi:release factor glutamine methyltransferase
MTISELIKFAIKKLGTSNALDAEVLLSHVLDKPKEYLVTNPEKEIKPKAEQKFKTFLARRTSGWPVAYLTKTKEFHKLKLHVDKNVLIPRPETEELVEIVLEKIKDKRNLSILDIGTGSGNIIISIAKKTKANIFYASDVSKKALIVARKNAKTHNAKITFKQGSLLKPWGKKHFDIIVANLPYLEKETDSSTRFEPKTALIAANKGLKLYEELFKQARHRSPVTCCLFLEIGHDQGLAIKKLAAKLLPAFKVQVYKDLSLKDRFARLDSTV